MKKTLKLGVGDTIVVRKWRKFGEKKMRCTGINDEKNDYCDKPRLVFDNGLEWSRDVLAKNFDLWLQRNGFEIQHKDGSCQKFSGRA